MSRFALSLLAVSALGACASLGQHAPAANAAGLTENSPARATPAAARPRTPDRHAREAITHQDMLTQMAFWAGEYDTFPNDLEAAQRFAEALRKGGRADRAVSVAQEALQRFPQDRPLALTYGLAQIAAHNPQEALRPLAVLRVVAQPKQGGALQDLVMAAPGGTTSALDWDPRIRHIPPQFQGL